MKHFKNFMTLVYAALIGLVSGIAVIPRVLLGTVGEKMHSALFGYMSRAGLVLHVGDAYGGPGGIPNAGDFQRYRVTNPDSSEVIRQRLYDFQIYPVAGQQEFTFFNQGQGNGVTSTPGAVVGSAKMQSDTNMQLGGQLPSGVEYLAETVEVWFTPGSSAVANTFVPAKFTTDATAVLAAAPISALNDMELFYNTGLLEWNILQKPYLTETPLKVFPPRVWFEVDAALATTAAELAIASAHVAGRVYYLEPQIALQPATNWSIKIKYPAAQANPSGFVGRVGIVLDGYMRRASQ